MDAGVAAIITGLFTIAGAALGALGTAWVGRTAAAQKAHELRQKQEELFFKALDYLSGGSQRRSLGIAAIENYWENLDYHPICVPLLIGSAIYLLNESKQDDAKHEVHNLRRIMELLLNKKQPLAIQSKDYEQLLIAVKANIGGVRGIDVNRELIESWQKTLLELLPQPTNTTTTDGVSMSTVQPEIQYARIGE